MHEQRAGEIADAAVGRIDVALAEGQERRFDRPRLDDQSGAGQRGLAAMGILAKAMRQTEELSLQRERGATEVLRRGGPRQALRAHNTSRKACPAQLAAIRRGRHVGRQAIAAEDAAKRRVEQPPHDRASQRSNHIESEGGRDQRPEPPLRAGPATPHWLLPRPVVCCRGSSESAARPRAAAAPPAWATRTRPSQRRYQRVELWAQLACDFVG